MTTLANAAQGYDLAGNLTLAYSADRGTSYQYKYDHHNRLTGVYDSTGSNRSAAFVLDTTHRANARRSLRNRSAHTDCGESRNALGRRIEFINDKSATTTRYYYDGVNEIVETNAAGTPANQRTYVHGISYVDERLMMKRCSNDRPYYYVLDSLTRRIGRRPSIAPQCSLAGRDAASQGYCVWLVLDRAGAVVERYAYDEYGRP